MQYVFKTNSLITSILFLSCILAQEAGAVGGSSTALSSIGQLIKTTQKSLTPATLICRQYSLKTLMNQRQKPPKFSEIKVWTKAENSNDNSDLTNSKGQKKLSEFLPPQPIDIPAGGEARIQHTLFFEEFFRTTQK